MYVAALYHSTNTSKCALQTNSTYQVINYLKAQQCEWTNASVWPYRTILSDRSEDPLQEVIVDHNVQEADGVEVAPETD